MREGGDRGAWKLLSSPLETPHVKSILLLMPLPLMLQTLTGPSPDHGHCVEAFTVIDDDDQ